MISQLKIYAKYSMGKLYKNLKFLLKKGIDIETKDIDGKTALIYASINENLEVL